MKPGDQVEAAKALLEMGQRVEACRALLGALREQPDHFEAAALLANSRFDGLRYTEILARIHKHRAPRSYLEIGVETGRTLALANPECLAIGVDPAPVIDQVLQAEARIYRETSDAFFAQRSADVLDGRPLDLAFIDGLHVFEQALRDFMHVEKWSHPNTVVLIHDCYPLTAYTATAERNSRFWSGDVWKILPLLARYRPDLDLRLIQSAPTGLAMISGLDATSTLLEAQWDEAVSEYRDAHYRESIVRELPLLPATWRAVREALPGSALT